MSNTQDHCPPRGITRPLIVNGRQVITCADCLGLFTSDHGDIDDTTHDFQCYECRDSNDTGDGWGVGFVSGDCWAGRAFAGALGSDSAPVCWSCGKAERVGDYCKACLSMQ
jgi:hypothetical protein